MRWRSGYGPIPGLYSYGLLALAYLVMAFVVMAYIVVVFWMWVKVGPYGHRMCQVMKRSAAIPTNRLISTTTMDPAIRRYQRSLSRPLKEALFCVFVRRKIITCTWDQFFCKKRNGEGGTESVLFLTDGVATLIPKQHTADLAPWVH